MMLHIIDATHDDPIVFQNELPEKSIVLLFPVRRSKLSNQDRWDAVVNTANHSDVGKLIIIDKTESFEATEYFTLIQNKITPDVWILQRPRNEPTHDSQRLIRIASGLWIIQVHDDDWWKGKLQLPPDRINSEILKTNFTVLESTRERKIENLDLPSCRAIFSLLPSSVWNRFSQLIEEQGGHVAGSIDSALNLVVRLMPQRKLQEFEYFYDNRHWESRKASTRQLMKITLEDGWEDLSSIEMALLGRLMDGIAALVFFSEFYSSEVRTNAITNWIATSKPHIVRRKLFPFLRYVKPIIVLLSRHSKNEKFRYLHMEKETYDIFSKVAETAWNADSLESLAIVPDLLLTLEGLGSLRNRFLWWSKVIELELGKGV